MTPYKRTEITVETHRILTIRRRRAMRAWCHECGREVEMVGQAEAEALTGLAKFALTDGAARGWHVSQGSNRTLLICLESVRKTD